VAQSLLNIDPDVLERLNKLCKSDSRYVPVNDAEKRVFNLLASLKMIARHLPGSDGYKVMLRNEM